MKTYKRSRKFSPPPPVPIKCALDYPYCEVWRVISKDYVTRARIKRIENESDRDAIARELNDFLAELYRVFVAAVERIESRDEMRLPLLRLLIIGDVNTRAGIKRLAIEIGDLLSHSQCFWLRPLTAREKDHFLTNSRTFTYSHRLFTIATELNR